MCSVSDGNTYQLVMNAKIGSMLNFRIKENSKFCILLKVEGLGPKQALC